MTPQNPITKARLFKNPINDQLFWSTEENPVCTIMRSSGGQVYYGKGPRDSKGHTIEGVPVGEWFDPNFKEANVLAIPVPIP